MGQGFVSHAQRRKWEQLRDEGRVTSDQFAARESETPKNLPERAKPRIRTVGASRAAATATKPRY